MIQNDQSDIVVRASQNSIIYFIGQLLSKAFNFLSIVLITNYLGKELVGKFTLALIYTVIFAYIVDFSSEMIAVREYARGKIKKDILVGNLVLFKLILWILTCILIFALIPVTEKYILQGLNEIKLLILIFCFNLIFSPKLPSIKTVFEISFKSSLRMHIPIIIDFFNSLVLIFLLLLAVRFKFDLTLITLLYTLSSVPGLIVLVIFAYREVKPRFYIQFSLWKYLMKESYPILVFNFIIRLSNRLDVFFIRKYFGNENVGIYSVAFRFTEPLNFIPIALVMSLFPLLSSFFENSSEKLESTYHFGLKFICFIMFPLSAVSILYASDLINLLYKPEYLPAVTPFQILMFAQVFTAVNIIINYFIISVGKQKAFIFVALALLIINFILNKILVPVYGITGAAVSLCFIACLTFLFYSYISRVNLEKFPVYSIIKFVIAISPLVFTGLFLKKSLYYFEMIPGIALYLIIAYYIKAFSETELSYFRKLFGRYFKTGSV